MSARECVVTCAVLLWRRESALLVVPVRIEHGLTHCMLYYVQMGAAAQTAKAVSQAGGRVGLSGVDVGVRVGLGVGVLWAFILRMRRGAKHSPHLKTQGIIQKA